MLPLITLAHMSDPHLGPMPPLWPWHWNLKRAVGYVNWMRRRRFRHIRALADLAVRDVRAQAVDHIAMTGDVANIGLPSELARALDWLRELGPPDRVTAIPGNHDIYCRLRRDRGIDRWADYMTGFEVAGKAPSAPVAGEFPFVRLLGRVALVCVNSAVPTPYYSARGEVGQAQRARLQHILRGLGDAGQCRIVLVHYPPLPGQATQWRHLADARDMDMVLRDAGAELVLHGHNHRQSVAFRQWRGRWFPIVGVPSCSSAPDSAEPAGYNIFRIYERADGFAVEMTQRRVTADGQGFVEVGRQFLTRDE